MPTYTTNYNLAKPLVNSAVDQDLWGNELNNDMDIIDTTMKSISDSVTAAKLALYPVGTVYINYSDSTNPATLLGFGTWTALTDRFLIGASGTYSAGTTGGATTHTLTPAEIPPLNYSVDTAANDENGTVRLCRGLNSLVSTVTAAITTNAGGGAHSILNPYVAVYMWRRTA